MRVGKFTQGKKELNHLKVVAMKKKFKLKVDILIGIFLQ